MDNLGLKGDRFRVLPSSRVLKVDQSSPNRWLVLFTARMFLPQTRTVPRQSGTFLFQIETIALKLETLLFQMEVKALKPATMSLATEPLQF